MAFSRYSRSAWPILGGAVVLALTFRAVIEGDGVGYYAFLHSVFVSHSLGFEREYSAALAAHVNVYLPWVTERNASGYLTDLFPVGPAALASPAYVVALALRPSGEPQYGSPFVEAFTLASLFYGLVGLALAYRLASRALGDPKAAFAGAGAALVATPFAFYLLTEPSYSHTFSVFCVSAFLYAWWSGSPSTVKGWFGLGVLGGLMAMTRFQDGLLMALVLIDWRRIRLPALALAPGMLVGFAPQLAVDWIQLGTLLPRPFPGHVIDPFHGRYLEVLFSSHHGLLVWTPSALPAAVGVFFVRDRRLKRACGLALLLELAITGAANDQGGSEFGTRRLLALVPFAVVGFAALAARVRPRLTWLGVAVFGAWNMVLIANHVYVAAGRDPGYTGLTIGQLAAVQYVPLLLAKGTVIRALFLAHNVVDGLTLLVFESACAAAAIAVASGLRIKTERLSPFRPPR